MGTCLRPLLHKAFSPALPVLLQMDNVTNEIENSVDMLVQKSVPWDYSRGGEGSQFEELRSELFDLKLDVLVWLDHLGSTLTHLLTFTRFAPLQVIFPANSVEYATMPQPCSPLAEPMRVAFLTLRPAF